MNNFRLLQLWRLFTQFKSWVARYIHERLIWRLALLIGIPVAAMALPTFAFAMSSPFSSGAGHQAYQNALNNLGWIQQTIVSIMTFFVNAVLSITGLHNSSHLVFGAKPVALPGFGAWPSGWWSHVISPVVTAMQALSMLVAISLLALMAIQYFMSAGTNPEARMAWSTALLHFVGSAALIGLFPLLMQWIFLINQGIVALMASLSGRTVSFFQLLPVPHGSVGFWGWFIIELILVGMTLWINLFFMFRALTLAILAAFGPLLGGITFMHPGLARIGMQYWRELALDIFQQAFLAAVVMMFFRVYTLTGSSSSWLLIAAFALLIPTLTNMFRGLFGQSAMGGRSAFMAAMGAGAVLGAMDLARQTSHAISGRSGSSRSAPSSGSESSGYVGRRSESASAPSVSAESLRGRDVRVNGGPLTGATSRFGGAVATARQVGGRVGHAAGAITGGIIGAGAGGFAGADIGARLGGAVGNRLGRASAGGAVATGALGSQMVGAGVDRGHQWWNDGGRDKVNGMFHPGSLAVHDTTETDSISSPINSASMSAAMDQGMEQNSIEPAWNVVDGAAVEGLYAAAENARSRVEPHIPGFDAGTNPDGRAAPTTYKGFLGQRLVGSPTATAHAPTAGLTAAEGRLGASREAWGLMGAGLGGASGQRVGQAVGTAASLRQYQQVRNQFQSAPDQAMSQLAVGQTLSMVQHPTHREMWVQTADGSKRIGVDTTHGDARVLAGSPHIQDYKVLATDALTERQTQSAVMLDADRALVPVGDGYIQHADVSLSSDFDAMVFSRNV